jgi:phosphoglycolate phosphatase-like HAD superfamily hydrolase
MPVSVAINDKNILTERKYLGAFIGNEVKIGIRVSTMPGVAIGDKAIIGPSTTVMHNVAPNVRYYTKMQEIVKKNMVKTASGVKDKVVLFDIDYTLFDTKLFKDSNLSTFSAYEEVIGVLQALGRDVTLGVFSEGDIDLQQTKLMRTALSTHFASDHIHIVAEKHKSLENILKKYEKQRLILVDDKLDILEKAKKIRSDVFTIWVRRGPFAEKAKPSVRFIPDAKVDNLHMALSFIAEI